MAVNVADLVATLRADVSNFVAGFKAADAAQATLAKTGGALDSALARLGVTGVSVGRILSSLASPTAAVGAAFTAMAGAVALSLEQYRQMGLEARRLAAVSGLSASAADDLADKFTLLGINSGALDVALIRLSADIDAGGGKLEQLGISIRDAAGAMKEPGAILLEVRERIAGITDAATQNATAMQLFGRGFRELAPAFRLTADEWERLGQRANELQPPWTKEDQDAALDMNRRIQELKLSFEALFMTISRAVYPKLIDAGKYLSDVGNQLTKQLGALSGASRGPLDWLFGLAGIAQGKFLEFSDAQVLGGMSADELRARREAAAAKSRAPVLTADNAMEFARRELERAEAAIARGGSRMAVGVGKVTGQRLELGAAGAFEETRRQVAAETALVSEAVAKRTVTETEAADRRLKLLAREREAVEAMFEERLRALRASTDYEINAELQLQNARAQALNQMEAQEEAARVARIAAAEQEHREAEDRATRRINLERTVAEVEDQIHEQRLRNLGRGAEADRAATGSKLRGVRRRADEELRQLDLDLDRMVRTVEVERWAEGQRRGIREKARRDADLTHEQERAQQKRLAEDSAEMIREVAAERRRMLDDAVAATFQAEGKSYDAARASATATTRAIAAEYAKRAADLDKMLRENQRSAEAVESARAAAAIRAAVGGAQAQVALHGAQRQAISAGAGVAGAPDALKGLEAIQRIRQDAVTMQQALRAALDSGEILYSEFRQAGEQFTESLLQRLSALTPAFTDVPNAVRRHARALEDQLRRRGGFENAASGGPMAAFRDQLAALDAQIQRVGSAAASVDGPLAGMQERFKALVGHAGELAGALAGLEGAMVGGRAAVAEGGAAAGATAAAATAAAATAAAAPAAAGGSSVAQILAYRDPLIDTLTPENAGRLLEQFRGPEGSEL